MNKDEFLRRLEDALSGEVPASVIRENLNYYADYLSQELGKGRTMDEIIEEIGEPNIVARTIINSAEAAGEMVMEALRMRPRGTMTEEARTDRKAVRTDPDRISTIMI